MSNLALQRLAVFHRDELCQKDRLDTDERCGGWLQTAHLPGKQEIKRRQEQLLRRLYLGEELTAAERHLTTTPLVEVVSDPRCAIALCERHHQLLDRRLVRLLEVPDHVSEFVADYGLEVELDRTLGR